MIPAPRTAPDDATDNVPAPLPDRALAEAAHTGDRDAIAELYRRHNAEVTRYIRHRTDSQTAAEDIAADTWARAIRCIVTFDDWRGAGFIGWIVTIARNLIADHAKSARRREHSVGDMFDAETRFGWGATPSSVRQTEDIVLDQIEADHLRATLLAAIDKLTDHQRACIIARFYDELDVADTAQLLGLATGATKTLQFRAVRTLARTLSTDPRTASETAP